MGIFVKVNDIRYPAIITGRLNDKEWNNRASKAIKVEMDYNDALATFVDDVVWFIEEEVENTVDKIDENGDVIYETIVDVISHDNSDYSIAGDIINHRDGTITVKMGKPTAEELLAMLEEGLA